MICKSIDILEKNFKHISTIVLDDIGNKIEEITYNKESIIEVIKDIKSYFLLRKCEYCSWLINEVCTNDKSPLCTMKYKKLIGLEK